MDVYDIVGVGFGPANLGVAIAAHEQPEGLSTLFLERQPTFQWHRGMLLDGATMQSSFLKDLVTLRNPRSDFSFLSYVQDHDRLEQFASLSTLYPSRVEFNDYFRWAAGRLAGSVRYSTEVRSIEPLPTIDAFRVSTVSRPDGVRREVLGRNVVVGVGGVPYLPPGTAASDRLLHSSEFLPGLAKTCPAVGGRHVFGVVGAGQSAGEIASYLLSTYPESEVRLIIRTAGPRRLDDNPFANDHFSSAESRRFYHLADRRDAELARLRTASHGVMSDELLERLYASEYDGRVRRSARFVIHRECEVAEAHDDGTAVTARLIGQDGSRSTLSCDLMVFATGYERSFARLPFMRQLDEVVERDDAGAVLISPAHRLQLRLPVPGGIYVQGYHQSDFGFGDPILSHIALRSASIVRDVYVKAASGDDAYVSSESPRSMTGGLE